MTTYYVDARAGSDRNGGTSPEDAWSSVDKVNAQDLKPGDTVLFRSGDIYHETLEPSSSGTASEPITYGSYGAGPDPQFDGRGRLQEAVLIRDVDHIRLENLEIKDSFQGVVLHNSTGAQLVDLEVHGHERNGILLKGSDHVRIEGGSSHHNGTVDVPGKNTNLGHGVLMSNGASNNVVTGMILYRNAEDGVQFSPDAGDRNLIAANEIYGNLEDGIDSKNGSQTLHGNYIHDNAANAVLMHKNSRGDTITLSENRLQSERGNPLDVSAGGNIVSKNNVYEDHNSIAVHLHRDAGKASFSGDTVIDNGRYAGDWTPVPGNGPLPEPEPGNGRPTPPVEQPPAAGGPGGVIDWAAIGWSLPRNAGDDNRIAGSGGDNKLAGGAKGDDIFGRDGDDVLEGRGGRDVLRGGNGDDELRGGNWADYLLGGKGDDRLEGGRGPDGLRGGKGEDLLDGGHGTDKLRGDGGDDVLSGGDGADILFGGNGQDRLDGGRGPDLLRGGVGDDVLNGGAGADVLHGGLGDDVLDGGAGSDSYVFEAGFGSDTIHGFQPRTDSIDLRGWSGLDPEAVMGGAVQHGNDVRIGFGDGSRLTVTDAQIADVEASMQFAESTGATAVHDPAPPGADPGGIESMSDLDSDSMAA